jgi:4-hydroxybenzoate polyprenyltransferase
MRMILWLAYRKMRPAMGISVAYILMSGAFLGVMGFMVFMAAAGFLLIELFAAFYNDRWDYADDMANKRTDKFTTLGVLDTKMCTALSAIFAVLSIFFLSFTGPLLLATGIFCIFLGVAYSHPKIRLKGSITGYSILVSPFIVIPVFIAMSGSVPVFNALPLSVFFVCQYLYVLCQKDSTDKNDKKNVFVAYGWERASRMIILFGGLASAFLFFLCLRNPALLGVWAANSVLKLANANTIKNMTVNRVSRGKIILLDYISQYLYVAVSLI